MRSHKWQGVELIQDVSILIHPFLLGAMIIDIDKKRAQRNETVRALG